MIMESIPVAGRAIVDIWVEGPGGRWGKWKIVGGFLDAAILLMRMG